jgi:hypothetical protein
VKDDRRFRLIGTESIGSYYNSWFEVFVTFALLDCCYADWMFSGFLARFRRTTPSPIISSINAFPL